MLKTILQILFGLALCVWIGTFLVNSSLAFTWEHHYPFGLNPPTWRSAVVLLLLIAITQWISLWAFHHRIALRVLFGLALCTAIIYLLIYSGLPTIWEGENLDGSISITWRSGIVLLLLIAVAQWTSFWTFRRRIALQVLVGMALCISTAVLLDYSSLAYSWESHNSDGTFPLTWRTNVVLLLLLSITQGLSFLGFRLIRLRTRRRHNLTTSAPPNI
jgi:hypothetical protein